MMLFWQLMDALQKLTTIFNSRKANVSDKLEASLKDLARTGDIQSCKVARKAADAALRESTKDLNSKLQNLNSSPRPLNIMPKVKIVLFLSDIHSAFAHNSCSNFCCFQIFWQLEALIAKEKEKQERLLQKHTIVVESYERKLPSKEIDSRISPHQQRISVLKQEIDDMLQSLDDF